MSYYFSKDGKRYYHCAICNIDIRSESSTNHNGSKGHNSRLLEINKDANIKHRYEPHTPRKVGRKLKPDKPKFYMWRCELCDFDCRLSNKLHHLRSFTHKFRSELV